MTAITLYEIAAAYRADVDRLADMDLDDATLTDTLEGLGGELEVKAQQVGAFIKNLEATAAAIKEAEAGMAARRKALENRIARVKDYLLASMMVAGVEKIECPLFRLSVKHNPPAVEVYEHLMIPSEFMRQKPPPAPEPDKAAIAAELKAGRDVSGCRLTRSVRLEIQ